MKKWEENYFFFETEDAGFTQWFIRENCTVVELGETVWKDCSAKSFDSKGHHAYTYKYDREFEGVCKYAPLNDETWEETLISRFYYNHDKKEFTERVLVDDPRFLDYNL